MTGAAIAGFLASASRSGLRDRFHPAAGMQGSDRRAPTSAPEPRFLPAIGAADRKSSIYSRTDLRGVGTADDVDIALAAVARRGVITGIHEPAELLGAQRPGIKVEIDRISPGWVRARERALAQG